jgi:hypothetical protein
MRLSTFWTQEEVSGLLFVFEEICALKRQLKPAKNASNKRRKAKYLLSAEINVTTSRQAVWVLFTLS